MRWLDLQKAGFDLFGFTYTGTEYFLAKINNETLAEKNKKYLLENGFKLHKSSNGFFAPINVLKARALSNLPEVISISVRKEDRFLNARKESKHEIDTISSIRSNSDRRIRKNSIPAHAGQISVGTGTNVHERDDYRVPGEHSKNSTEIDAEKNQRLEGTNTLGEEISRALPGTGSTEQSNNNDSQRGNNKRDVVDDSANGLNHNPDHFFITDEITREGGFQSQKRYKENIAAYQILKNFEAAGEKATDQEKAQMVRFNGWGGLAEVFDTYIARTKKSGPWVEEAHAQLKELLTQSEYDSALNSVNNSHYTNPIVVRSIWAGLQKMGFKGGSILEPSLGVGTFLGLAPQEIVANSKFFGIEKDELPGRLAQQIYPNAKIIIQGYEETTLPDNWFDLAISNVPFGDYSVFDKEYPEWSKHSIHDFFFLKTMEKVKPNGIIAFITSTYTMDKTTSTIRRQLHKKAEFLGAIRLPVNNQLAQAGTSVSTDIIFLRKRSKDLLIDIDEKHDWLTSIDMEFKDEITKGISKKPVNTYFQKHPEQIAGELFLDKGIYGHYRVSVTNSTDEELATTLKKITGEMFEKEVAEHISPFAPSERIEVEDIQDEITTVEISVEFPEYNNFGSFVLNPDDPDFIYQIVAKGSTDETYRAERQDKIQGKTFLRVKDLIGIKDKLNDLFRQEKKLHDGWIEKNQVEITRGNLNQIYDAFVKNHGPLNLPVNSRLFIDDPEFGRVMALEHYDYKTKKALKADIFEQSVVSSREKITSADSPQDALLISLDTYGAINLPAISQLTDIPESKVIESLKESEHIFFDPSKNDWVLATEYLSGNVKQKLKNAQAAALLEPKTYQQNIDCLLKVQPKDLMPSEIFVRLGAPWIPTEDVKAFITEKMELSGSQSRNITVHYRSLNGQWVIGGVNTSLRRELLSVNDYGTDRRTFYDILENSLNQKTIAVYDSFEEDGHIKQILNRPDTLAAQQKQELVQNEFSDFLWKDETRAERLLRIYNDKFNNIVSPRHDGSHLTFPGMSITVKPRICQANAVWRYLLTGNILLGHEVGVGKTLEQVVIAMEAKRLGKAHKPMIVVLNSMLEQITRESQQIYPNAKILMTTLKDLEKENRRLFMGKVSNNNWDLVVITHSMFGKVGVGPNFEKQFLQSMLSDYRAELSGIDMADQDVKRKYGVKQIETKIKSLEGRLKTLTHNLEQNKDFGITLDDMGIDMILIDEAHNFKNLDIPNAGSEVTTGIQGSQKAWDLYLKTKWLYDKHGKEVGICEATGTPVSNSVFEIYNIQRRLQPKLLKERGINSINSWAASFLSPKTQWEPSPSGSGFTLRTRYELINIPELMQMLRSVMDVVRADDANIKRPEMTTVNITAPMSEAQKAYMHHLDERVINIRNFNIDRSEDNLLKIVSEGRRLALDHRLLATHFVKAGIEVAPEGDHKDKLDLLIETTAKTYHKTAANRATQLVFCDLGTPGGKKPYNVYDRIKNGLINLNVKPEEVAFIHDYNTDKAKAILFKMVRDGDIRIMIGSTGKMGEGINVQERAVAIHHADPPWRPSDIEQRDARIKRYGNLFDDVTRYIYTTEDTFDLFMWNLLKVKAETFSRIMSGDKSIRRFDLAIDPTYAETAAITSNNVLLKEKLEVDQQVSKIEMLKSAFLDNRHINKSKLRDLKRIQLEYQSAMQGYLDIPKITDDPTIWTVNLISRGADKDFKGTKDKLLPVLAKIFKDENVDFIEGITCGGVPLRLNRIKEEEKHYTTWVLLNAQNKEIKTLEFKSTPKVENLLLYKEDRITSLQMEINNVVEKIEKLENEVIKEFDLTEKYLELKNKQKQIEEKIKQSEKENEEESEKSEEEPESVLVM